MGKKSHAAKPYSSKPSSVAVVGGGIGGVTTVLELITRSQTPGSNFTITLYEQAGSIGHQKSASGIIAASMIFNSQDQYWHIFDDAEDMDKMNTVEVDISQSRRIAAFARNQLTLKLNGDKRMNKENKKRFFEASRIRLEELVDQFPKLCGAIIGPYCCRTNSSAKAWMDRNGQKCSADRGWAHAFFTEDEWEHANDAEKAAVGAWRISAPGSHKHTAVERFLRVNGEVHGVLWQEDDLGFVRVEDLFHIFNEIFQDAGNVAVKTGCNVQAVQDKAEGVKVVTQNCSDDDIFDRVIVSAGANSIKVLPDDHMLYEELLPVKGFACATNADLIPQAMRGMGVQHEEKAHYIRPQKNGGVRYGFGKVIGVDDAELINPVYDAKWETGPAGIGQTELGRKVLEQPDVQKLAGIRPLSVYGNFPILKRYTDDFGRGVVVNTGFGWHGFVMAWKSAQFAADLAFNSKLSEDWEWASDDYDGCHWLAVGCNFRDLISGSRPLWCHSLLQVFLLALIPSVLAAKPLAIK